MEAQGAASVSTRSPKSNKGSSRPSRLRLPDSRRILILTMFRRETGFVSTAAFIGSRFFPEGSSRPELWSLWSSNREEETQGVYGHQTALSLHELSDVMPAKLHMTVPPRFRRNSEIPRMLVLHFANIPQSDIGTAHGVPVTNPMRTILICYTAGMCLLRIFGKHSRRTTTRSDSQKPNCGGQKTCLRIKTIANLVSNIAQRLQSGIAVPMCQLCQNVLGRTPAFDKVVSRR